MEQNFFTFMYRRKDILVMVKINEGIDPKEHPLLSGHIRRKGSKCFKIDCVLGPLNDEYPFVSVVIEDQALINEYLSMPGVMAVTAEKTMQEAEKEIKELKEEIKELKKKIRERDAIILTLKKVSFEPVEEEEEEDENEEGEEEEEEEL